VRQCAAAVRAAVCGRCAHGSVRAVRAVRGSVRQCDSMQQCERQCAVVRVWQYAR
jgi:hypothetical protein